MDAYEVGAALCAPFLDALPVAGLSISVVSEGGAQSTIGTSDQVASRLEELQFQLGEGPTADVLHSGLPVLTPDLTADSAVRTWPVFTASAFDTGARAMFSFPMTVGGIRVGVVSLYASETRPRWSEAQLRTATGLVDAAVRPAMALATRSANAEDPPSGPRRPELRREVHQASGMVMVQLRCSVDDALTRLRARAFAEGRSIDEVAREVVRRTLRFGGHRE